MAVASVARIVSAVSQPTVSSQEIAVGSLLPRTPNAARESTIVGAEPRLPASATMPQSRNENRIPTTPATTACQNEIPNPSVNAPYDSPSTETFAPNHGQNRSAGRPVRSASEITLMPLPSTASARPSPVFVTSTTGSPSADVSGQP